MTTNFVSEREAGWNGYVHRIAGGDEAALESLMKESKPLVAAIAKRVLTLPGDEDEVISDVFLQVWRRAHTFDPSRGSAAAWVSQIAKTRAIDQKRRQCSRTDQLASHGTHTLRHEASTHAHADRSHARLIVKQAMQNLPFDQLRLVQLAFLSGFSHSEIARDLKLPLGTVKFRIRLGMGKLRGALCAR